MMGCFVQVVHDCIIDVCMGLNIIDPVEMEEYTLFVRTGKTFVGFIFDGLDDVVLISILISMI